MFKYLSDKSILLNVFKTYSEQQATDVKTHLEHALSANPISLEVTTPAKAVLINASDNTIDTLKSNLFSLFLDQEKLIGALNTLTPEELVTIHNIWSSASESLHTLAKAKLKTIQQKLSKALDAETTPSIDEFKLSVAKAKLAALHQGNQQDLTNNVTYLDKVI